MMDNNLRADPRFEVRIRGKLMWANGASSKDCTIKDLSEGGAQVDTIVFTDVPTTLDLFEGKNGDIFECVVRWQRGPMIGLQFLDVCSRSKRRGLIERHALRVASKML
jgi:PilZ domain-containing protein